ncbi:class I poly(R)-hydroxyalkanoic acid synthase [Shewanella salipaludis]|uniref:Class I poly(R)-hydroxyalkanoic acid synthase n=1 Tax=Shewanella salipaludis TaxID=2723052 RepID=A0A972G0I3_9GAMM|nr:class I poly(R)-hydroxyalkanoic acid synthase [Shewanella salipaludis]NMH64934.1 class I poly(R)-hydroxyalkanoic acid synthase [Shewanella salipaludis]
MTAHKDWEQECFELGKSYWQVFDNLWQQGNSYWQGDGGEQWAEAVKQANQAWLGNPSGLFSLYNQWLEKQQQLWQQTSQRLLGGQFHTVAEPRTGDQRFNHPQWQSHPLFDFIKQAYLINSEYLDALFAQLPELDPKMRRQLQFNTRQYISALAPTNFPWSNPDVIEQTLASGGKNLSEGLKRLADDLENSPLGLNLPMTDLNAFKLGENIAATPGQVVFQNRLMQLIQYQPSTDTVAKRPLLLVPPWINKFYVLDLKPQNSLIKYLVDQGHSLFVISWVNPDASLAEVSFEDYMQEGPLAALEAIALATGEQQVNILGYCIGGTLLACTQALLASRRSKRIASTTYLTTLLDFADPGEIGVFINEQSVTALERQMQQVGFFDGRMMALGFNMLRENDLFWSFFISNYLKGELPPAFDLLYWNSDSTNLPAAMHSFYLRQMYLENKLVKDELKLAGRYLRLGKIATPSYFLATEKDHIAKWQACFQGARAHGGDKTFVLAGSGHIAGVINPPSAQKYGYSTCADLALEPLEWQHRAERHNGSWWEHWQAWLKPLRGAEVPARQPGDGQLPVLEAAPGSYVRKRL